MSIVQIKRETVLKYRDLYINTVDHYIIDLFLTANFRKHTQGMVSN